MACRISEIVIEARDPELLARFWAEVLDYVEIGRKGNSVEIGPPGTGFGGAEPVLIFDRTNSAPRVKLPLHIDVSPTDRDQEDELARLLALGARPADIGQTGEESWRVLMDPEGNEFCLLRARIEPVRRP